MSLQLSRKSQRRGTFAPRVENLEDRCTPTATLSGNTLLVTGTNITITDTGRQFNASTPNQVIMTVVSDGVTQNFTSDIRSVQVTGNRGGDVITYNLGGNQENPTGVTGPITANSPFTVRAQRNITVNLGSGKNFFFLNLLQDETFINANYNFTVLGGSGRDIMLAQGRNQTLDNTSALNINMFGLGGDDNISADIGATVGSVFGTDFGPATTGPAARGGELTVNTIGGSGNDRMMTVLDIDRFSQGTVNALALGSGGDNLVGLVIDEDAITGADRANLQSAFPTSTFPNFNAQNFTQTRPSASLDGGSGSNHTIFSLNLTSVQHTGRSVFV